MRTLVVLPVASGRDPGSGSLGSRKSVQKLLSSMNTHPESESGDILYGPGIEFELAPNQDLVVQMILKVTDEDIGWLVIERIGRALKWKFVDINSGDELVLTRH